MDLYSRARSAGKIATELGESVDDFVAGIRAIYRDDFASAWWFLSLGGFCPDGSKEAHAAWIARKVPIGIDAPVGVQTALFSPDVTARNGGGR